MITGFNQDVTYRGKVYHVQTEDRGLGNPVIETLIYVGGEILASLKTPYGELLKDGYDESKVAALLEQQHKRVVVDVRLGKYAKEKAPQAFGEGIITSRSLDEVILEYLTSESEGEKLQVEILDQSPLVEGERGWFNLRATTHISASPLEGAAVEVSLVGSDGRRALLFSGKTGPQGLCSAAFSLPPGSGGSVVLLEVAHQRGTFSQKALVTRGGTP
ncbi:MAG: hypothetical protein ACP5VN_03080 [Acidobacteriota bacterium]